MMWFKALALSIALAGVHCSSSASPRPSNDGAADGSRETSVASDGASRPGSDASTDRIAVAPSEDAGSDAPSIFAEDAAEAAAPRDAADATTVDAAAADSATSSDGPGDGAADAVSSPDAGSTCSDGTAVAYVRSSCPGAPASAPSGLASSAAHASFGDVISLDGLDDSSLPCFPVRICAPSTAPTLIFSDEPESPSADGILYADDLVTGAYRAYVYHVNAGSGLRKFPVVLLNQGAATVHAIVSAKGLAGPSEDYVDVGKQAALRWYASRGQASEVDVPPGERVLLDDDLDGLEASNDELVHGIVDFTVDGPVKLSVVSVEASEDATTVTSGLSLLANTGQHQRGTFPGADLEIETSAPLDGAGVRHLRLGANVTDSSLVGHDYVDDTTVTLDGNYGVAYAIRLALAAGDGSALLLSPQGGDWGGAGYLGSASAALLPGSQDALGSQTDAIALGAISGAATGTLNLLSAGGSSLPVDLVTVPLP